MDSGGAVSGTRERISASGRSIYDAPEAGHLYDMQALEACLHAALKGQVWNYPLRTRSKVAKAEVAKALGYPVPKTFKKCQPRFPAQDLDVYVQKSNNLQIWNEEVSPARRYALIRLNEADEVVAVRVLTGEAIALLDKTGTLTTKFQARRSAGPGGSLLVNSVDTDWFLEQSRPVSDLDSQTLRAQDPASPPSPGESIPIADVFQALSTLVGSKFADPGLTQERLRGTIVHQLVVEVLGLGPYRDAGQFPDVLSQALEVKLQLSPTIDLGLVSPDSAEPAIELGSSLRHCDVRYAIFYAERNASDIEITEVVVASGESFFTEFVKFQGRISNSKLQIPLPQSLFEPEGLLDQSVDL